MDLWQKNGTVAFILRWLQLEGGLNGDLINPCSCRTLTHKRVPKALHVTCKKFLSVQTVLLLTELKYY